jgi:hypothetical protein
MLSLSRPAEVGFSLDLPKWKGEKGVEGGGELEMERRESEAGRRGGVGAVLQVEDAMAGRHVPLRSAMPSAALLFSFGPHSRAPFE